MKTLNNFLKYLPLLAPLPEGYAVGLAIARELAWHWSIVVIAAVIVAGTGFWGVQVFNRMSEFNTTLFEDEKKLKLNAPTWKTLVVLGIWFAGVTLLTVFLDAYPVLKSLTPLGLVVIGFSAAYLFSLSNVQQEREEARTSHRVTKAHNREVLRNERKESRNSAKVREQEMAKIRQAIAPKTQAGQARNRSKSGSKLSPELLLFEWARDPYLTDTDMVDRLWDNGKGIQVSRQAVGQRRYTMIQKGIIMQETDGRIVEVIAVPADVVPL